MIRCYKPWLDVRERENCYLVFRCGIAVRYVMSIINESNRKNDPQRNFYSVWSLVIVIVTRFYHVWVKQ
jgi:hypothetical protein